jgi:hypothetical protein
MPLTQQQREAVRALDWILEPDEHRRTGRSFSQAVALVRVAARYPGTRFGCQDHASSLVRGPLGAQNTNRILLGYIRGLIERDDVLEAHAHYASTVSGRESFWFDAAMSPILDWWPELEISLPPTLEEHAVERLFTDVTTPMPKPVVAADSLSRWAYL